MLYEAAVAFSRHQRVRLALASVVLALIVAAPAPAQARPITFAFKGVVDNVVDSGGTIYPEYVDYGSPFSGTFTFESTTPASPVNAWQNNYPDAVLSLQAQVGKLLVSETPPAVSSFEVVNDAPRSAINKLDSYGMIATIELFGHPTYFEIAFIDYTAQILSSSALPENPPIFDPTRFRFQMLDSGTGMEGPITSFTVIPEPGGISMIALGAIAVLARRRRRAKH